MRSEEVFHQVLQNYAAGNMSVSRNLCPVNLSLTSRLIDWLNDNSIISGQPVHLSMLSGVLLTSTLNNILSMPLPTFLHNHCPNNRQQWERNESCLNHYHKSSERILAKPGIEPLTSCSLTSRTTGAVTRQSVTIKIKLQRAIIIISSLEILNVWYFARLALKLHYLFPKRSIIFFYIVNLKHL